MLIQAMVLAALSVPGTPKTTDRAQAQPRVAVTSATLFLRGSLRPDAQAVYRHLEGGLARAELEVVTAAQVLRGLASRPSLQGCETPRCLIDIGRHVDAPFLAKVKARGKGRDVQLEVVLTWAHSGLSATRAKGRCRGCTTVALYREVARLATVAGRKAARAYRETPPPPRRTRPKSNGGKPPVTPRSRPYVVSGGATLGAGLVATVAGAVLLALDGRTAHSTEAYQDVYRTRPTGIAAITLGVAAAATGAVLLVYGLLRRGKPAPPVSIAVDPQRRTVLLRLSF